MDAAAATLQRNVIRGYIKEFLWERLPNDIPLRKRRRMISRQSLTFENFLYKVAPNMEYYSDLDTFERRMMGAAEAILLARFAREAAAAGRPLESMEFRPSGNSFI